jgi:hypothetical protein
MIRLQDSTGPPYTARNPNRGPRGKRGKTGPQGAEGQDGATGATGATGPAGPAGIASIGVPANGLALSPSSVLTLSSASGASAGAVTTSAQTFAGLKTITDGLTVNAGPSTLNGGVVNIATDNASNAVNIGLGTTARAINIGNSAAAHTINIGNDTINGGKILMGTGIPANGSEFSVVAGGIVMRRYFDSDSARETLSIGSGGSPLHLIIGNDEAFTSPTTIFLGGSVTNPSVSIIADQVTLAGVTSTLVGTTSSSAATQIFGYRLSTQIITSSGATLTRGDSGSIFLIDASGGAVLINLPAIDSGAGLSGVFYRFIVGTPGSAITIRAAAAAIQSATLFAQTAVAADATNNIGIACVNKTDVIFQANALAGSFY